MLCFVFEKMSSSIHMVLMLFIHVGKRSNSRLQMFFKTGVLNNFAKITGKHLCWSLFCKVAGCRPAFSLKKTFPKFYVMIDIIYFKVIFYYGRIRSRSRKNFTIDRSKRLVNRCFFLNQDFKSPSRMVFSDLIISLLQRIVRS